MTATTTALPKMKRNTWLGQPGEQGEIRLSSKATGERIVIHRWLETGEQGAKGEVTVRRITGDGWRDPDNFREFSSQTFLNPTDDTLIAAVERA